MPPPYRSAASPVLNPANGGATGFGATIIRQGDFRLSSGKNFKMQNFGRVLSNFAPSPVMPAGKLYTTPTVLSSWEALKKTNSV